ncbi:MAG: hypothetical protein ACXWWC_10855, partial [Chitinophagaceae bacterium]
MSKSSQKTDPATRQWFEGKEWLNGLLIKPHETIDKMEFKKQYEANKQGWDKAFDYLRKKDFENLAPG